MNISDSTDRLISSTITDTIKHRRKAMFEYYFVLNNNMSKFITLIPTGHNKVLYTYGKDNLLKGMTLNNQKTLDFVYDGIGRPTSHTFNLIYPLTTAYTYHGITSGGTVYKNNLIRTEKIGNGDFWYLYHYDANNNINRLYQNAENEDNKVLLEDYSYDALNQLENVNYYDRHERHEYTYDNGGNITEEKVYDTSGSTPVLTATNTYTYGDNSWGDLLTEYNGDTITYDEIGNPLNYRDGISFTWSNGRQLQSYTKNNSTINYTYDSSGMRLSKTIGGTTHTYLYNSGLLIQERIGNQKLDYSYTSNGQILSVKYTEDVNSNETPVYYYYALNSRGDVVGLYDHEGKLYAKYTYDVWGNPVSVTNASNVEITSPTDFANIQPIRYRSYYYDTDTGFYYLQSRYYDPVTHRFINSDGLVSTGIGVLDYNMFAYCENNPINFSDPKGEKIYSFNFVGPLGRNDIRLGLHGVEKGGQTISIPSSVSKEYTVSYDANNNHGTIGYDLNDYRGTFLWAAQAPAKYKELNHEALQQLYDQGMDEITLEAEAQLWGETLLHAYGYMVWDLSGYTQILSTKNSPLGTIEPYVEKFLYKHCNTIELDIVNSCPDDTHSGFVGYAINYVSKVIGGCFSYF